MPTLKELLSLPDPGGVFQSDVHRRVLAHMPEPGEDESNMSLLKDRLDSDIWFTYPEAEVDLARVVADLIDEGFADGIIMTQEGYDALTGPVVNEPPPLTGLALKEAEEQHERIAKEQAQMEAEGNG